jgi:hypothetical protein
MPTSHAPAALAARSGPSWYTKCTGTVEMPVVRRTAFVDASICETVLSPRL